LPSSDLLPVPDKQPQNDATAGIGHLDDLQSELKTVQQQALATQQALKTLQTQGRASPVTAIWADHHEMPMADSMLLGLAGALTVGLALLWWYVWHRPRARLAAMPSRALQSTAPGSTYDSVLASNNGALTASPALRTTAPGGDTHDGPSSHVALDIDLDVPLSAQIARADAGLGFDSEAAANEVTRVRKSLAEKREARSLIRERDETADQDRAPSVRAWLDVGDSPKSASSTATPVPAAEMPDPWRQVGESPYAGALPAANDDNLIEFSFSLPDEMDAAPVADAVVPEAPMAPASDPPMLPHHEIDLGLKIEPVHQPEAQPTVDLAQSHTEPPPEPEPELEPASVTVGEAGLADSSQVPSQDYAVTLALAQESAGLELWQEARDLAIEVLESEDEALQSGAQDLLERINRLELSFEPDAIPWHETR
jgi:hypothetical protein